MKLPTPPPPRPNGWNWLGREKPSTPIETIPFTEKRSKKKRRRGGFKRSSA